jgi:hypothetical protein
MRSAEEIVAAVRLLEQFHAENQGRDAQMLARGVVPDMVDALLCSAQLSVLAWFLDEETVLRETPDSAGHFDSTLDRLRERYQNT